jgi:phosphomannomutase
LQSYQENSIPCIPINHLMTLIKSISGIRGTIGGRPGDGLTPPDIVRFTAAFGTWALHNSPNSGAKPCMVVGRDARISGQMVDALVCSTLMGLGIDVINAGLATTPTVEMAVPESHAIAGIILTASHNPGQWNALKLLNHLGEFISGPQGEEVLMLAEQDMYEFAPADKLGSYENRDFLPFHIEKILELPEVDRKAIREAGFRVAVDAVNSVGGIAVPAILEALGVKDIYKINCNPDGLFAHNPEPLPAHLTDLSREVVKRGADMGIAVDPDVDRLAFMNEDGSFFGEEYTLVAVADYILTHKPGNTVSNMSSSRALKLVTEKHGGSYLATAVGEVNVVTGMKLSGAVIGGEGNGGVIFPGLHYGRDSLVGIALFLSHLAHQKLTLTGLRALYPDFEMSKKKIDLIPGTKVERILEALAVSNERFHLQTQDGLKIDRPDGWVHLRRSNTEPIIRIIAEAETKTAADQLADSYIADIMGLVKNC